MFRILIADDENSVVQSLLESIPWEELEIQVAGTACDGQQALQLVREQEIDIAILDIRMPGISGLELCEQLKKINEQIQVIIISGYAEFAYAEKAIQYGVIGYCLKPLEYFQVIKCLRKAVQNLKVSRHMAVREDLMEILERGDREEIRECLEKMGFPGGKCYVVASVGEKRLAELKKISISMRLGRGQWGYLIHMNEAKSLLEELRAKGCNQQHIKLPDGQGIGYMEKPVEAGEIYDALEECIIRAYQYFVNREHCICGETDESRANVWLDRVRTEFSQNRWEKISYILTEIREKGMDDFSVRSSLRLCNLILSSKPYRPEENDYYVYSIKTLVTEYGTLENMLVMLKQYLEEKNTEAQMAFSNTTFMKLIKYINENYRGNISLSGAAQAVCMNPNYVSQLFKKETGVTFINYITQKRLDDAKELLVTTPKSLNDIAVEVGFNDYFYFIKTFKKFTGMTPGQYRMQK